MKKIVVIAASLLLALGLALCGFEGRVLWRQRGVLRDQRARLQKAEAQRDAWRPRASAAETELKAARQKTVVTEGPAQPDAQAAAEAEVRGWVLRVRQLKRAFVDHPEQRIPEMDLLTDFDWILLARAAVLEDEEGLRKALADVRTTAKFQFSAGMSEALRKFVSARAGQLPLSTVELTPYFEKPPPAGALERYEMRQRGVAANASHGFPAIAESQPVDREFDVRATIGASGGYSWTSPWSDVVESIMSALDVFTRATGQRPNDAAEIVPYVDSMVVRGLLTAQREYQKANGGNEPRAPADLIPYATDPAVRKELERLQKAKAH